MIIVFISGLRDYRGLFVFFCLLMYLNFLNTSENSIDYLCDISKLFFNHSPQLPTNVPIQELMIKGCSQAPTSGCQGLQSHPTAPNPWTVSVYMEEPGVIFTNKRTRWVIISQLWAEKLPPRRLTQEPWPWE